MSMASSGLVWALSIAFVHVILVETKCNYSHRLLAGEVKYVSSPGFPYSYGRNARCVWQYESEVGTRIVLSCHVVNIPWSDRCLGDHLTVSLTGDTRFRYNQKTTRKYCGDRTVVLISEENRIALGLASTEKSKGGTVYCSATEVSNTTVSPKKEVSKCECGTTSNVIRQINGNNKTLTQYPFMVGLFHVVPRKIYCGATIISDRYVLTAGHCVRLMNTSHIAVMIGQKLHAVQSYHIHPEFKPPNPMGDIAVVGVAKAFKFAPDLGPVCLPFRYTGRDFDGQPVRELSWRYPGSSQKSYILKVMNLTVIPEEECQADYGQKISKKELCTSSNKRSCQNSSGGPILWYDTATKTTLLLGITTSESGCSGIDVKVTSYLSWIIKNTKNTGYCIK